MFRYSMIFVNIVTTLFLGILFPAYYLVFYLFCYVLWISIFHIVLVVSVAISGIINLIFIIDKYK